jgi:hypothetical protein
VNQGGLFDMMGDDAHGSSTQEPDLVDAVPWGIKERLTQEKTAIGFYLSGHLFDEVAREVRRLCARQIDELMDSREPQMLAGIVSDFRVINGQRGQAGLFKLDDKSGVIDARPTRPCSTYRNLLKDDDLDGAIGRSPHLDVGHGVAGNLVGEDDVGLDLGGDLAGIAGGRACGALRIAGGRFVAGGAGHAGDAAQVGVALGLELLLGASGFFLVSGLLGELFLLRLARLGGFLLPLLLRLFLGQAFLLLRALEASFFSASSFWRRFCSCSSFCCVAWASASFFWRASAISASRCLPTLGRSITLGVSGAVTMKMISSTSITSMKGTMLISLMVRRPRPRDAMAGMAGSRVQWPEAASAGPPRLRCRMLENSSMKVSSWLATRSMSRASGCRPPPPEWRQTGRWRWPPAPRQCRGHGGQRDLLHAGQAGEGVHDAPHRAEQAHIGRHRADRGQERQVGLDHVHLALEAGAHGAAGAVEQVPGSVMRRSRSFWYSRMPLAKMRSIGPAFLAFCAALAYRSFRLVPDQNSRSKSSLSAFTRFRANSLRKMAAQLATETMSSSSMTSCTTQLALQHQVRMDISWDS